MCIYIYRYIENAHATPPHFNVCFEIWVLWGYARFFVLFASGSLGWLLLGWILASAWILCVLPRFGGPWQPVTD